MLRGFFQNDLPKYTNTCLLKENKLSDNLYPTRCKTGSLFSSDIPFFIKMGSSFVYGVLRITRNNEWILKFGRPKQN